MLDSLLRKGFFLPELPPPFNTEEFANFASNLTAADLNTYNKRPPISRPSSHSRARVGTLRRTYSIPNPNNFLALASAIDEQSSWLIDRASDSPLSSSKPIASDNASRGIQRSSSFRDLPRHRAYARRSSRYVVQADVSRCYHSIYSHAIPWALHGREAAKQERRQNALHGNRLDKLVRDSQSGQTIGLPIGPESSYLIAEVILSAVDRELASRAAPLTGFRYVDDYELGTDDYSEAEDLLAHLEQALSVYELSLNPSKTSIVALPNTTEDAWIRDLAFSTDGSSTSTAEYYRIQRHFDTAFRLAITHPTHSVLKYALRPLESAEIRPENWPFLQDCALQCCMVEPGLLDVALHLLDEHRHRGQEIDYSGIRDVLNSVAYHHGRLQHGHEVAWAIWGLMRFNLTLSDRATEAVSMMDDVFVAQLAYDAKERGLIASDADFSYWDATIASRATNDASWLLVYEQSLGTHSDRTAGKSPVRQLRTSFFQDLADAEISFYDYSLSEPANRNDEPFEIERASGYDEPDEEDDDFPPPGVDSDWLEF